MTVLEARGRPVLGDLVRWRAMSEAAIRLGRFRFSPVTVAKQYQTMYAHCLGHLSTHN